VVSRSGNCFLPKCGKFWLAHIGSVANFRGRTLCLFIERMKLHLDYRFGAKHGLACG
jgi:hypothetical protein